MSTPLWSQFVDIVHSVNRVVLTAHLRPDGDCIGSEIAMALALESLGKHVTIINPHPTPPALASVDPTGRIRPLDELTDTDRAAIDQAELLIVLDTRSWQQLGAMRPIIEGMSAKKVVIDHHEFGDAIADAEFIDATAEAAGRIVFDAVNALGVPLTRDIAEAIFAAIVTDTGWFRFSSVSANTLRVAAALIEAGVRVDEQYRVLHEQETLGRTRLVGRTLTKTQPHLDGRLMVTSITQDDLREAGALPSDTEDVVNLTLRIKGSLMAALLAEQRDGSYKVSFRSRCKEVDCSQLAKSFGGGGHRSAAGATLTMPFDEAEQAVINAFAQALSHGGSMPPLLHG